MSSSEKSLDDAMDRFYGAGAWTQRTGINTGSDIVPAINQALTGFYGDLIVPPGVWLARNPVETSLLSGRRIRGCGSQRSIIVYAKGSGAAFHFGSISGGGIDGLGILLESGLGDALSYGVLLQGNAANQPDQTMFRDIYISAIGGSSFWWNGFTIDGSARSTPLGARVIQLDNIQVFNCRNLGVLINRGVFVHMQQVGIWTGKPGTWGNNLQIQDSNQVLGDAIVVSGAVRVVASTRIHLAGYAGAKETDGSNTYLDDLRTN